MIVSDIAMNMVDVDNDVNSCITMLFPGLVVDKYVRKTSEDIFILKIRGIA